MSLPAWHGDKNDRRARNRSSATQERDHAKAVGGKVQAGSGSSWRAAGDVKSANYMDELKETSNNSFSITMIIIHKIMRAANQSGRDPRLIIDFKEHGVRAIVTFEDL